MSLSEEIRKISLYVFASGRVCELPEHLGLNCDDYPGGCGDCIASALNMLADRVQELEMHSMPKGMEWVREHGDFDEVKRAMQDSDNRRVELCSALGIDTGTGWSDAVVEMDKRLMPNGYEWPRYEDGEKVRIGDYVQTEADETDKLRQVRMCRQGFYLCTDTCDEWHRNGERVKRPKTDPIGADGLPIKKGDKMRILDKICTREYCTVQKFGMSGIDGSLLVFDEFGTGWKPLDLAHIEEEQTDSWERLEEDMSDDMTQQQCGPVSPEVATAHAAEFVRRAKALAEKENNHED